MNATVFVIEDDQAISTSLRFLFESVHLSVETYYSGFDYLKVYDPERMGCLLIDIRLPSMSGLELQEHLVQRNNPLPIIILTGHGDITLAVRAMKAGAKDFILKPYNNEILLEQVQKSIAENIAYHHTTRKFLLCLTRLTSREKEIITLLVEGQANKQIAAALGVTVSTIEQHRAHIMQKTEMKSLAELVKLYTLTHQKRRYEEADKQR